MRTMVLPPGRMPVLEAVAAGHERNEKLHMLVESEEKMRLVSAGLGLFLPLLRHSRSRGFLGFLGKKPVILHGAFN